MNRSKEKKPQQNQRVKKNEEQLESNVERERAYYFDVLPK